MLQVRNLMSRSRSLNDIEQYVMLALLRLGEEAYGVSIRDEIEARAGRSISMAAVYAALERLQRAGRVTSFLSDPRPERGGRARKHFQVSAEGVDALASAHAAMDRMRAGVALQQDPERR